MLLKVVGGKQTGNKGWAAPDYSNHSTRHWKAIQRCEGKIFVLEDFLTLIRESGTGWLCLCLESREGESHLKSGDCKIYGDLTYKYSDLMSDDNLADLFREVLARREHLTKQTNNPVGGENTSVSANCVPGGLQYAGLGSEPVD